MISIRRFFVNVCLVTAFVTTSTIWYISRKPASTVTVPCLRNLRAMARTRHFKLTAPSWEKLEEMHAEVNAGGAWRPNSCTASHQVAIVIPIRDRDVHLRLFLHYMHPFLQRQMLDYKIYVIEQKSQSGFNRGMLMNVGYVEALRQRAWPCFIFHDVDLLPENDANHYTCRTSPRHLSVAINKYNYRLPFKGIFGGVECFTTEHYAAINGFSNEFFGWGGEDDDLYRRFELLRKSRLNHSSEVDGLSNLRNLYTASVGTFKLFTLLSVYIRQREADDVVKVNVSKSQVRSVQAMAKELKIDKVPSRNETKTR